MWKKEGGEASQGKQQDHHENKGTGQHENLSPAFTNLPLSMSTRSTTYYQGDTRVSANMFVLLRRKSTLRTLPVQHNAHSTCLHCLCFCFGKDHLANLSTAKFVGEAHLEAAWQLRGCMSCISSTQNGTFNDIFLCEHSHDCSG